MRALKLKMQCLEDWKRQMTNGNPYKPKEAGREVKDGKDNKWQRA